MYNKYFIEKKVAFGSYHQLSKYYESAADFTDAFNHTAAIDLWEKAAYYKQSDNNFSGAGALFRRVAGIKEDRNDVKGAIAYYDKAAESYFSAGSIVTGAQCKAMKGQLIAKGGDLRGAAEVFVEMVKNDQASAEDLVCCFKAQLCIFTIAALRDEYDMAVKHDQMLGEICLRWGPSYEHRVVKKLMKAYEQGPSGVRAFTKACSDYDTVSNLDEWTTSLLLQVKRVMAGKIAPVDLDSDSDDADADFKDSALSRETENVLADDDISEFFNFDENMMREIKKDKRSQADIVSTRLQ
jgi:tetratricopeptide (TPR) repeat protein